MIVGCEQDCDWGASFDVRRATFDVSEQLFTAWSKFSCVGAIFSVDEQLQLCWINYLCQ